MEAFSLLKYWRGNGSNSFAISRTTTTIDSSTSSTSTSSSATTIVTTVSPRSSHEVEEDDDGPFFDFEFTLPDETQKKTEEKNLNSDVEDSDDEESEDSDETEEVDDKNITLSPPTDENLFFKDQIVSIEPSSFEANQKISISLSKSAAKFMLKLKKLKGNNPRKGQKSNFTNVDENGEDEENRFSKDMIQKYLKKVKPLALHNIRVSKLRFSGQLTAEVVKDGDATEVAVENNVKTLKQVNGGSSTAGLGLLVVCKRLGKSKSGSLSTVVVGAADPSVSRRRDDSLLQQQDGIQGAILHCKRSFNASRDSESSILSRSTSDPSNEKTLGLSNEACCPAEGKMA